MAAEPGLSFGELLRRHRLDAGLTQAALAARAGLSARGIQSLEHGLRRPYPDTVARLVRALDLVGGRRARFEEAGRSGPRPPTAGQGPEADAAPLHNLPAQLTSLIGRDEELEELGRALESARLLTLTGVGGCGKTRLALALAARALAAHPDGVWLVELAPLRDPRLVPSVVAAVLDVREGSGRPIQAALIAALRRQRLLLLLDNCEHLVDACAYLAETVLRAAPDVRILATSREPLRAEGELIYRVPSLATAPLADASSPEDVASYAASRLFVERAARTRPDFALSPDNVVAVAQICAHLDGIPLALELAAARLAVLSIDQIAARLNDRFRLLTGGRRAALPRYQTMQASIAWSYDLLEPAERMLFARVCVFAGTFDLPAAEAVCAGGPGGSSVVDGLESLLAKSLLQSIARAGGVRLLVLETIREFGREKLVARGELDDMCARHAAYYGAWVDEVDRHQGNFRSARWLDAIETEQENVRAALRWAIERGDAALAGHLAWRVMAYWYYRGHYREGRALLDAVLALPADAGPAATRADLFRGRGMLTRQQGDYAAARADLEEAVAIARQIGDPNLLCQNLVARGVTARVQEDYATAGPDLREGLALARAAGEKRVTANALRQLGLVALEADQDLGAASSLGEASLALYREMGNRHMVGLVMGDLARVARARSDLAGARALLRDGLAEYEDVGDAGAIPQWLFAAAAVEADVGRIHRAVRLAAVASRLDESAGRLIWPAIRRERDAWLEPARATLGEVDFAQAWAHGQEMSLGQAITYALAETPARN